VVRNALEKQIPTESSAPRTKSHPVSRQAVWKQVADVTKPFLNEHAAIFSTSLLSFLESNCAIEDWDARFAKALASLPQLQPSNHDGDKIAHTPERKAHLGSESVERCDCSEQVMPSTGLLSALPASSTYEAGDSIKKKRRVSCRLEGNFCSCRLDSPGLQGSEDAWQRWPAHTNRCGESSEVQPSLLAGTVSPLIGKSLSALHVATLCERECVCGDGILGVECKPHASDRDPASHVPARQNAITDRADVSTSIEANSNSDTLQSRGSHSGSESHDVGL
jgi:hypothetical protein